MNVLIVVDMQNDFIDGSLGTEEALAIVGNVVKRIEQSEDELILFTKDTHATDYLNTQEGKNLPVEHCIQGTDGWHINPYVRAAWRNNKNTRIDKNLKNNTLCKNTFGSKDLVAYLQQIEGSIDEIILIGLCTDICVLSNAILIKAFMPELKITVIESCCAGVTPKSHQTAIDAMKMCQVCID